MYKQNGVDVHGPSSWTIHVTTDSTPAEADLMRENEKLLMAKANEFCGIEKAFRRSSGKTLVFNVTAEVAGQAIGGKAEKAIAQAHELLQKLERYLDAL